MKNYRETLTFTTETRRAFLQITDQIRELIEKSGIREGLCLISTMHITSSVFINNDENGLMEDFSDFLEKLAPENYPYRHNRGNPNGDAHLKRTVMGREAVIAVTEGKPDLGPYEEIFYGEFDGMRPKRVLVKIIGE